MRMERCYLWIVAEAFSDRLKFKSIVKGGVTKELLQKYWRSD